MQSRGKLLVSLARKNNAKTGEIKALNAKRFSEAKRKKPSDVAKNLLKEFSEVTVQSVASDGNSRDDKDMEQFRQETLKELELSSLLFPSDATL